MNPRMLALFVTVAGGLGSLNASTHVNLSLAIGEPGPVVVRHAPPAPLVERVVVSPGPGYTWVAGHHSWRNGRWVWVPGVWVQPPQPRAVWVAGRWDSATGTWIESHWEISAATPVVAIPAAPVTAPTEVIVYAPPPPPRFEHRGHRPGADFVWIRGCWVFRDGHHVWEAGRWDRPPQGRHKWVDARWERRGGNYAFVEGCWR